MVKWITTLLLCLVFLVAPAQITIRGQVVDEKTGIPIENANLVVKGTIYGAASDQEGKFNMSVQKLPVHLVISEIRHYTKTFIVTSGDILVKLSPKVQMLDEVSIGEDRIVNIQPGRNYYAYDFEFYGDYIMVLAYKKTRKKSTLFLLENDGKEIYSEDLRLVPDRLYLDFTGNVHLLTADSAFQVYYDYKQILLLYSMPRSEFLSTMHQCKAAHNDCILINRKQYRGLESLYMSVGENHRQVFYEIADSAKRSYLEQKYDLKYFIDLRNKGIEQFMVSVKTLRENLDFYRQMVSTDWLDSQILKPVFAPLHKIDDTVYIFDYTHGEIIQFDSDLDILKKIPCEFHKGKNWSGRLLIDDTWQEVYTTYTHDGITHIAHLDRKTFKPLETIRVEGHIYIDKIRIRNGQAYFLHKNHFRNTHRMIYRMGLW